MPVQRGSTSQVTVIKEATAGTTPATPTMVEMPVVSFTPTHTNAVFKSSQIRAHPFIDQMAQGRLSHDFGLEVELAGAVHDTLFETMFGSVIATKTMKFLDALLSLTIEEKIATGVFNQFTYGCFSQMTISASASDTAPVKVAFTGMARNGVLDAAATLATVVTPAASTTPFTFAGGTATLAGNATPISAGSLQFQRQVDPLVLLGAVLPREFVPSLVDITGTMTVPYDASGFGSGATIAPLLTGFTDVAQVWKFADASAAVFRQFTIPKTKFLSLGRSLSDRGMRMQNVNWEAIYDGTSTTACTLATQ